MCEIKINVCNVDEVYETLINAMSKDQLAQLVVYLLEYLTDDEESLDVSPI